MNKPTTLLFIAALFLNFSCAYNRVKFDGNGPSAQNEQGGLSAQTVWIKNKKDSIDTLVHLKNDYKFPVMVKSSGVFMKLGSDKVAANDGSLYLAPQQSAEKLLVFKFGQNKIKEGVAVLSIESILNADDPSKTLSPLQLNLPAVK